MQIEYFSHARTGLKLFLKSIEGIKKNKILLPDYICDSIVHTIKEVNFECKFYSLNDSLEPNWDEIENINLAEIKAIVMVHYFGQPQDVNKFINFAKINNIILIEDNAHTFESFYLNQKLGTFGDVGISSPRKILNVISGGILYVNHEKHFFKYKRLLKLKSPKISILYCILKNKFTKIHYYFHKLLNKKLKFDNPLKEQSLKINDLKIDHYSFRKIINLSKNDIKQIKINRQKQYNNWLIFCDQNNLKPVIKNYNKDSIPWCFPAYTNNILESEKWHLWGRKNNLDVFSWPSLPIEIINKNNNALNRWGKLICFPINNNEN